MGCLRLSLHAKPAALASTALIQRILKERYHRLTDGAALAHIPTIPMDTVRYLQIPADILCRYRICTDLSVGMM